MGPGAGHDHGTESMAAPMPCARCPARLTTVRVTVAIATLSTTPPARISGCVSGTSVKNTAPSVTRISVSAMAPARFVVVPAQRRQPAFDLFQQRDRAKQFEGRKRRGPVNHHLQKSVDRRQ